MSSTLLDRGTGVLASLRSSVISCGYAFRQGASELVETVFPSQCEICGELTEWRRKYGAICADCTRAFTPKTHVCARCSAPVPSSTQLGEDCIHCQRLRWSFRRAICLGAYDDRIRQAVILAKSRYHEGLALRLGELLADYLETLSVQAYDLIIPTPQHWLRRIVHRSNNSELFAEVLSQRLKVPSHRTWLRRTRQTQKQGMLSTEQRRENVANAFSVSKWAKLSSKRVLLVDDIVTSGSTANEMSKVLKRSGAAVVDVAAIARGIGNHPAGKA